MRRVVLVALVLLGFAAQRSRADHTTDERVSALLLRFSRVEAMSAHFREEKHMALLVTPLLSEGMLYYQKPRLLARHTQKPTRSSLVLREGELTFGDAQHSESLALSAQPALQVLIDTFVAVLSGDAQALERMATVRFEPLLAGPASGGPAASAEAFHLTITPSDPSVRKIVRSMTFDGEDAVLKRMELVDANGDRTVTTFDDVRLRGRYPADEVKRIFRVGG
jgi:outer membrane lipoprotein-sorting protein